MNKELEDVMRTEESDQLFFYFKHDGSIDFEKKIIAGKILEERGFDKQKLLEEKQLITDSIKDRIASYENTDQITAKNKRKINSDIFLGLGYVTVFILFGLKDYLTHNEPVDWLVILVMIALAVSFIMYKLITYDSKLKRLLERDMKDKELQKLRLQFIGKEWNF